MATQARRPPPSPQHPSATTTTSTATTATPTHHPPKSTPPPAPRRKPRVPDSVINDHHEKPVDVFHVRLSQLRANLRVVEPRPVVLSVDFDSYWCAETDVYSRDVDPVWRFNNATVRTLRPASQTSTVTPPSDSSTPVPVAPTSSNHKLRPTLASDARFVYETEFGYKLHRKYMVVRLSERSPFGDVEWGSAAIPIDSIARGCEQLNLSILAPDGVTCYGIVYCTVSMLNVQNVRVHLTDLHLSQYPDAYTYDLKLIYLHLGVRPFENGLDVCTEKRSDSEPRFLAQPVLYRNASLRDMLISSASGGPSLKVFFSVRRQVARDRTEEIGMGALPVRMLFAKVAEGWMDVPTKFKVPLSGLKGIIRGKVLLRNIPQFSQLPGADLFNADGVVMPADVDLNSRKLLPWVKLPRSMDGRTRSVVGGRAASSTTVSETTAATVGTVPGEGGALRAVDSRETAVYEERAIVDVYDGEMTPAAAAAAAAGMRGRGHERRRSVGRSEVGEPVSEDGSEGSYNGATAGAVGRDGANVVYSYETSPAAAAAAAAQARARARYGAAVGGDGEEQEQEEGVMQRGRGRFDGEGDGGLSVSWGVEECVSGVNGGADAGAGAGAGGGGSVSGTAGREDDGQEVRSMASKSGKSVGSYGTTEGTVEIGSVVLSQASDDGLGGGASVSARASEEWGVVGGRRIAVGGTGRVSGHGWRRESVDSVAEVEAEVVVGATVEVERRTEVDDAGKARDGKEEVEGSGDVTNGVGGAGEVKETTVDDVASTEWARRPTETTAVEAEHEVSAAAVEAGSGQGEGQGVGEDVEYAGDEWVAIEHGPTRQFYFVHRETQESLWLPPDWARLEDERGLQFFVDHASKTTQRAFPAAEARAYRESVFAG